MREHNRIPFRPTSRMTASSPATDRLIGYVGDISEGGLRLLSDEPVPVGNRLDLRLRVRDQEGRTRQAEVRMVCQWSRESPQSGYYEAGMALERRSVGFSELLTVMRAAGKPSDEDEELAQRQRGEGGGG